MGVTLAPRIPEAIEMVDNMQAGLAASGDKWQRNTAKPRKDPVAQAIKANALYKEQVQKSLAEDRYVKGLQNVDQAAMTATILATPASAVADGVARRRDKTVKRFSKLRGLLVSHVQAMDAMPTNSEADKINKMVANLKGMKAIGTQMRQ